MKKVKHSWTVPAYMAHLPDENRVGYRLGFFGICKQHFEGWVVWHLPTLKRITTLDDTSLRVCEAKVREAQTWHVSWDSDDARLIATQLRGLEN
jgi:hypothetical protein